MLRTRTHRSGGHLDPQIPFSQLPAQPGVKQPGHQRILFLRMVLQTFFHGLCCFPGHRIFFFQLFQIISDMGPGTDGAVGNEGTARLQESRQPFASSICWRVRKLRPQVLPQVPRA